MHLEIPATKQRFYYLDSARGVAAMSVIVWHFIAAFTYLAQQNTLSVSPLHLLWYGEADVIFFFVHSGFILAYSYTGNDKLLTVNSYTRFLIERFFRIYPLFIFILAISYIVKQSVFPLSDGSFTSEHMQIFWNHPYTISTVLKEAILFIAIPKEGNLRLLPQDWTLTIEIVVGALIPLMGVLMRKNKWFYWPVIFLAIYLLRLNTFIFEFACGVFLFYSWPGIQHLWKKINFSLKMVIFSTGIVLYSCLFYFPSLFNFSRVLIRPGIDRFMVTSGCCLLFIVIISSSVVQKLLSLPWLVKIGRICYSIYLVHMLLLICFADYFMHLLHHWLTLNDFSYVLIAFIVFIAATILISMVTYSFIEKPFNKLGKRLGKKITNLLPG